MSGLPSSPTIDLPSPYEPLINSDGTISPIWYKYFQSNTLGDQSSPALVSFLQSLLSVLGITSTQQDIASIQAQLAATENNSLSGLLSDIDVRLSRLEPRWPTEELILAILSSSSFSSVEIYGEVTGALDQNQVVWRWVASQNLTFRGGMFGSRGVCNVQATGSPTLSWRKNGVQFGTMQYPAATTPATFTGSKTPFVSGDVLTLVTPNVAPDATLEGLSWNLLAKHSQFA